MQTEKKRLDNLAEVGYKARSETEVFLNRWFDDNTKGWAVRSGLINRYEDHFSTTPVIRFNEGLSYSVLCKEKHKKIL